MTTRREFDDGSEQEFGNRRDDQLLPGVTAFLGGTFVGAVLGCAVAYAFKSFGLAGDEPPIRVKGGSLFLELGGNGAVWKPRGTDGTKWRLHCGGPRGKEEYDVSIVTSNAGCSQKAPVGKTVLIEYTAGTVIRSVEIKAPGKTTLVDASHKLHLTNNDRTLMWDVDGYISKIDVDGSVCHFASKTDLTHAILSDF